MKDEHYLLRWFVYEHLSEDAQAVSKPFGDLAREIVKVTSPGSEQTTALRKLLESKDAAVRAFFQGE